MNRRDFAKLVLAAGAAGPVSFGITRAIGQTRGGILNTVIQPEPPILVSALNQQAPTLTVCGKIYESLLTYDFDLTPKPGMAQSWERSPDGLTYTFKLFPGITFHDGSPMTADDVVFSITKALMEAHARARGTFSRLASAEAPDPLTVVFRLKAPFAPFLHAFDATTAPIISKALYENTDLRQNPNNARAIGTGPFKLKEWVKGSHIHLVRHEGYYRKGEPHLDEIYYRVIPDAASRAVALESGTIQLTQWNDVEAFDVPRLKALPNLDMTTKGYEFYAPHLWLEMNTRIAPMNDKRFRQAVLYAIDREALRKRVFFGLGKVATGPVSSKTRFYEPDVRQYEYSPAKAAALLDAMGLKPGADGKRVSLKYLVPPYGEMWQRVAEYVRQSLGKVGIDIVLEGIDVGGWAARCGNWEFEISAPWTYQYGDPALGVSRSYIASNIRKGILFSNTSGYSNPAVDQLFEDAAVAQDDAKRQKLYSQVQKILVEDAAVAWLMELDFPTFTDKHVKDLVVTGSGVNDTFARAYRA